MCVCVSEIERESKVTAQKGSLKTSIFIGMDKLQLRLRQEKKKWKKEDKGRIIIEDSILYKNGEHFHNYRNIQRKIKTHLLHLLIVI